MYAIPPNNYDFYTEEEKYVRTARGRGARNLVVAPNETRATFLDAERKTRRFSLSRGFTENAERGPPTTSSPRPS